MKSATAEIEDLGRKIEALERTRRRLVKALLEVEAIRRADALAGAIERITRQEKQVVWLTPPRERIRRGRFRVIRSR